MTTTTWVSRYETHLEIWWKPCFSGWGSCSDAKHYLEPSCNTWSGSQGMAQLKDLWKANQIVRSRCIANKYFREVSQPQLFQRDRQGWGMRRSRCPQRLFFPQMSSMTRRRCSSTSWTGELEIFKSGILRFSFAASPFYFTLSSSHWLLSQSGFSR